MESAKEKSFFTRVFPTPKFLAMPAVGIDISDDSIRFVELVNKKEGKILSRFGEYKIPAGLVLNGEIQDVEKLSEELKKIKEENDIESIRASLPEEKVYLFQTHIPEDAKEDQIRSILEFRLEEHVPLSLKEAVFDYEIINRQDSKEHIDVSVAVYPKKTISKYTSAFNKAEMLSLSFEIEAQAISRAVIREGDDGTYMIVSFGKMRTGLAIISDGVLAFTSTLEVEEEGLSKAIMKHLSVPESDVARIKSKEGLVGSKSNKALFTALLDVVETLKDNIDKHYRYWRTRVDEKGNRVEQIEKIILCGENSNLKGLPEYLSGALKIPVERANVWINAFSFDDFIPEMTRFQSLSYAAAIGLALRETN
ncbi:MAG: pilus assembly protein PilM [Candidatus Pacebacteria bacterium]|jgi:type IV pilus assembly protein PilM|nr:pilus assembly protein PilM [Candidatus Paceibacterota bacterium]|tara:strand:- start:32132 stop:33229 length:1098 start_codon:yes stop_codon:yes gene_type:complete